MNNLLRGFLSILLGVFCAIAHFVYLFLPGFTIMDVLTFGLFGAGLAYLWPERWWFWATFMVAPSVIFSGAMIYRHGADTLRNGVGTGHLVAMILIPVAAGVGGFLVRRRRNVDGPRSVSGAAV